MNKKVQDILLSAIQGCRDDLAGIDRDLAADREGNEKTAMALIGLQEQISQLIKRLEIIEKKIQDRVADAVAPAMEQVQELKEMIVDKKVVAIDKTETKKQLKSWYMFWKFW